MPFKNLGNDPETAFYEFSLADAVITELARVRADGQHHEQRQRLLRALADVRFDYTRWFAQFKSLHGETVQRAVLAGAPADPIPAEVQGVQALRVITQDPVYQLK